MMRDKILSWQKMLRLADEMAIMNDHICTVISDCDIPVIELFPCLGLSRASFYDKLKNKRFTAKEMVLIINEILEVKFNNKKIIKQPKSIKTMFEKQKIGTLSRSDKAEMETIRKYYEELCYTLNGIKFGLEEVLNDFEDVSLEFVISFLKSDPDDFIKRKFAERKKVDIKGVSKEALIRSDLLDVPKEQYNYLVSDHKKYHAILASIDKFTNFKSGLELFYRNEDEDMIFILTPEFEAALVEFYTHYTRNEAENEQLNALNAFANAVNGLMKVGLIRNDSRWLTDIRFHPTAWDLDKKSDNPLSLNHKFFFIRRRFNTTKLTVQ